MHTNYKALFVLTCQFFNARLTLAIQDYGIQITQIAGKDNTLADAISRILIHTYILLTRKPANICAKKYVNQGEYQENDEKLKVILNTPRGTTNFSDYSLVNDALMKGRRVNLHLYSLKI